MSRRDLQVNTSAWIQYQGKPGVPLMIGSAGRILHTAPIIHTLFQLRNFQKDKLILSTNSNYGGEGS